MILVENCAFVHYKELRLSDQEFNYRKHSCWFRFINLEGRMSQLNLHGEKKIIVSLIMIVFVSLIFILDPRFFTNPPLRSDDWNMLIEPVVFDSITFFNFSDRRPFLLLLYAVLSPILQLRISLYYAVNWLLILFSGLTVYKIIRDAFPKHRWLALPGALIFLIYPVNYARTWLVISINTLAFLFGLLTILLLVHYSRKGQTWRIIMANLLALISLGTYEAALGIILIATVLLLIDRETPKKRRLWIFTIPVTIIIFLLWRLVIQPQFFAVTDFYLTNATVSLPTVIRRYGQGLFIFLYNWVGPLLNPLGDNKYWVFVICGTLLIVFLIVLVWRRIKVMGEIKDGLRAEKFGDAKALLRISGIGLLFWAAGYIPVIFLWQPYFYGDGSRVNFGAIPGASLVIVALMGALFTILFNDRNLVKKRVLIFVIPLVVAGMAYQVHAQNVRQRVWEVNQDFWGEMFELVPGVVTGTKVVIVIPNYENVGPFEMLPFRGDWEAESALRVLYNNRELYAEYYYIDWTGAPDNWQPIGGDLGRFVFVYYDPGLNETRIVQDPFEALNLPFPIENYDPDKGIIPFEQDMGEFRFLVE